MPSPNNPPPKIFSNAQNPSLHDSILSNTSGHLISVNVANHFTPGNFHSLAQSSSENQDLPSELGQVMEEYPAMQGPPAPGFALNRNNLEVKDSPITNSSNEPLPNAMGSGSWSSTNCSLVSLISDNESEFMPSEMMSRCSTSDEVYVKSMLPLRQGYPLSAPQPISSLSVDKRRVGTIIGDVGTIRDDGSFDYLFNPLLPTTDPKNPHDLPTAFNDVSPPFARTSQVRSAFNSRTALCSLGSHCDTNHETMELTISHTSDNGALLFLPDGASKEDLINSGEMKQFIIKHAETWISYAISTGRDIDRNSLYFVTGCTKAGDWGMVTFNRSPPFEESSLKLGQSTHPDDPRYIWERSRGCGMARTGPGPDEELDDERTVPRNQTLFLKGYKIAFSEEAWTRILAESIVAVNTGQSMNGSTSEIDTGRGQTSGESQAPSSGNAIYNTSNCNRMNLEPFPAYDKLFHPSDTINKVLLEEVPDAEMAISHDDDWCELTNGYDLIDSDLVVQLLRSKYSASYYEGAAVLCTTQDAISVDDETIAGHTMQKPADFEEEEDGKDEYIVTSDDEITQDNGLRKILVNLLPRVVKRRVLPNTSSMKIRISAGSLFLGTATFLANGGPVGLLLGYMTVGTVCYSIMISLGEMIAYLPIFGGHITEAELSDPAFSSGCYNKWVIVLPLELSAACILIGFCNTTINPAVWITICMVVVFKINLMGAGVYGKAEFIFASIKVITITGLVILEIVLDLGGKLFDGIPGSKGRFLGFWAVLAQAAFSFIGTEIVAIAAGEAENPKRNLPKAIKRVYIRILLFYIGGTLIIGLLVPSNNPDLKLSSGTAASSPFVIAIQTAGIKALPLIINACLLTSAWWAASSDLFTSSRATYGLAASGNAPRFFLNTLGIVAVLFNSCFAHLIYMGVKKGSSSGQVFTYFSAMTSIAGLVTWFGIALTYKGMQAQSRDRTKLPYYTKLQPLAAWYAVCSISLIMLLSGWAVFLRGHWVTSTFITKYLALVLPPILYFGGRFYYKEGPKKPRKMDFVTNIAEIEADTHDVPPPRNSARNRWKAELDLVGIL